MTHRSSVFCAAVHALAGCRASLPAHEPTRSDAGEPPPSPAPDASAQAGIPAANDDRGAPVVELDARTERLLIEYRIREIEDLLAADAIEPSGQDPTGIWRVEEFFVMAFGSGDSAWTFTLLPTEPDLRMPSGNAPDWVRVTKASGERFNGRVQSDRDAWLQASGELAAGGRAFRVECQEKDGSVAFDVVLDRGLGVETRDSLRAAVVWLSNRLRQLESEDEASSSG